MLPLRPHDPPVIGVHRLHARLGEDACSRVYLASAPGRAPAALKIVRAEYTSDLAFREAFTHLVDSARQLRGRYVAPIVDADLQAATPWVAVAREPGPTLDEVVGEHGPLPPTALHPLALALAQGLAELHAADRAHGSLWPDGVLLTRSHAMIADAGFERAAAEVEQRAPHPSFAPPEGGAAPATDVFAWAATLCFAASGVKGPGGLDQVPIQLRGLMDACLKVDPVLRPDAADLVRMLGGPAEPAPWPTELSAVVERHEAEARGYLPGPGDAGASGERGPGSGRGRGRGRAVALAAGALALTLVAGTAAAWVLLRPGGASAGGAEGGSGDGFTEGDGSGAPVILSDADCLDGSGFPDPSGEIDDLDAMEVAFSPDGDVLAVSSFGHGLTLWDWREGAEIARPTEAVYGQGNPVFAPAGCAVTALDVVEYERDERPNGLITTYDIPSGTATEHLGPQPERVEQGLESPQGGRLMAFAPSGETLAVVVDEGTGLPSVGIVDTSTGEQRAVWDADTTGSVRGIAFLDEDLVATADWTSITIRDAETGEPEQVIRDATTPDFAVVPGGSEIVYVSNDQLIHWDQEERTELGRFPITDFHEAARDDAHITGLAVSAELGLLHFSWTSPAPDAGAGADAGEGSVAETGGTGRGGEHTGHLWELAGGEDLLAGDSATAPRPVAFHPDGETIAAVQGDGSVALLDPESLAALRALP